MATCRKCGHTLHEGATFCGECGTSVYESEGDSSGFGYGDSGHGASSGYGDSGYDSSGDGDSGYGDSGYDASGDGASSTALSRGRELARDGESGASGAYGTQGGGRGSASGPDSDEGLYANLEDVPGRRAGSSSLEDALNGRRRPGDPRRGQEGGITSFTDMYHAAAGISAGTGVTGAMVEKTLTSLDKGVDGLSGLFGGDPGSEVILPNGKVGLPRKKSTAMILLLLGGWLGIHKFYEQKIALGIAYMLTFGFWLIGPMVDFFVLLFGKDSVYYVEKP